VGGSAPPSTTPTSTPAPARLQVTAREFSLTLSRASIAGGPAVVEFVDGGQDPHDLHIRSTGTNADVFALPVSLPGSHTDQAITLPPGTYTLYCSLPQHAQLGMQATLTVN
jgi:plastocyanin